MKKLLLTLLLMIPFASMAQVFYVEPTEKGFEKEISQKLDFEGFKVTHEKSSADFIVSYHYQKNRKNYKFEGYIKVSDKSGNEIYRTTTIAKAASAFNGYQAVPVVVAQLTEKELVPKLKSGIN